MGSNSVRPEQTEIRDKESIDNRSLSEQEQLLHESFDDLITALEQKYHEAIQSGENSQFQESGLPAHPIGTASVEAQILQAIQELTDLFGKAYTRDIAATVNLSSVQTWRYLTKLEESQIIQRIGNRGGWIIAVK